ncbi:hypothetical protein GQ44DRAFT_729750 [Phaeosphaeriaceae sp. PMI808]|nr:hypothetical protein GQ44DRAFT_729750 [Phaeosphaeriaceae sp. PMI808]
MAVFSSSIVRKLAAAVYSAQVFYLGSEEPSGTTEGGASQLPVSCAASNSIMAFGGKRPFSDGTADMAFTQTSELEFRDGVERTAGLMQTIVAQPYYLSFSEEELRVEDYQNRKGVIHTTRQVPVFKPKLNWMSTFTRHAYRTSATSNRRSENCLQLLKTNTKRLRGPIIQICIGPEICQCQSTKLATCECINTWFLPKALISHFSPFLQAACTRNFKEREENRIELPKDDPTTFALYVEWLYHGDYTDPGPNGDPNDPNIHAKCWIMGDKFLDVELKNKAMSYLYPQYASWVFNSKSVQPSELQYILNNTGPDSKLRKFYLTVFVQYYTNPLKVKGTAEQWDDALEGHADARVLLFRTFQRGIRWDEFVKAEEVYMDGEEPLLGAIKELSELKLESQDSLDTSLVTSQILDGN